MSTLHRAVTAQYTDHYAQVNPTIDPSAMPDRFYRNMDLMYGPFIGGLANGEAVADLGCGTGFLLYWLARFKHLRIQGVDASETQVNCAQRAVPTAKVVTGDIRTFLETSTEHFGGLFCMDVLEHIESDEDLFAILKTAKLRLRPGGAFICRVPNASHILGTYSRYIDITHHRGFSSHSLRQALNATGFHDVQFIPAQSSIPLGKLRLGLEYWLHRGLFLLGGHPQERIFTQNLIAIARR